MAFVTTEVVSPRASRQTQCTVGGRVRMSDTYRIESSLWVLLLALCLGVGCDDQGGGAAALDCDDPGRGCAAGYVCVPEGGAHFCQVLDDASRSLDGVRPDWSVRFDAALLPDMGPPEAAPGGPCSDGKLPCVEGACREAPSGNFCHVACDDDADCGSSECALHSDGQGACFETCSSGTCRIGWACDTRLIPGVCRPSCQSTGCPDDLSCEISGLCVSVAPCRAETCNGLDDDCDDVIDEGVANACGTCGSLQNDVCDGIDQDCDGRIDEDPSCGAMGACRDGECVELADRAGPCGEDADCLGGRCLSAGGGGGPGGFCAERCARQNDCGVEHTCQPMGLEVFCFERCTPNHPMECRVGWVCQPVQNRVGMCVGDCALAGCADDLRCDEASGLCAAPRVRVTLEQVVIAPGTFDGSEWDGTGSIPPEATQLVLIALGTPAPLAALIGAFQDPAMEALSVPDPKGTATLVVDGIDQEAHELEERHNTFTPVWDESWVDIPMGRDNDIRLRVEVWDNDPFFDDEIGIATVSADNLYRALVTREPQSVVVQRQGAGQILLISVAVTRLR